MKRNKEELRELLYEIERRFLREDNIGFFIIELFEYLVTKVRLITDVPDFDSCDSKILDTITKVLFPENSFDMFPVISVLGTCRDAYIHEGYRNCLLTLRLLLNYEDELKKLCKTVELNFNSIETALLVSKWYRMAPSLTKREGVFKCTQIMIEKELSCTPCD